MFLRWLYPHALWRINPHERAVYLTFRIHGERRRVFLTFDDGPIPVVTPWVLDVLKHYGIHATFFMVGENAYKHPHELAMVRDAGHRIGNHTYNHIGGTATAPTCATLTRPICCCIPTFSARPTVG